MCSCLFARRACVNRDFRVYWKIERTNYDRSTVLYRRLRVEIKLILLVDRFGPRFLAAADDDLELK